MYSYIYGLIKELGSNYVVIDNSGIGYLIYVVTSYQFPNQLETFISLMST